MAVASRFVLPFQTVIDAAGIPLPGAQLAFYQSGTNIPLNTYSDAGLTVPNANPVVANAAGVFPNIFMLAQAYKVVLLDADDVQIWTADPVYGMGGGGGANLARRLVTGNATVLNTDGILEVDASAGACTVIFPLALGASNQVQKVSIVKVDTTNNPVNIIDDGAATIRYALAVAANGDLMQSCDVYSTGAALRIIN